MGKRVDLTGQRFGRLVVESFAHLDARSHSMWNCKCDCGKSVVVAADNLRRGNQKSCGCSKRENLIQANLKHGDSYTKLHGVWKSMLERTRNVKSKAYKHYGERGITVCDEWLNDFASFRDWALASGYREGLTIDRIDVNGNYCPGNCRWTTMKAQARNRRTNTRITYSGETLTLAEWSERLGIKKQTLWDRINKLGWSIQEAFETPVNSKK